MPCFTVNKFDSIFRNFVIKCSQRKRKSVEKIKNLIKGNNQIQEPTLIDFFLKLCFDKLSKLLVRERG